MTQMNLVELAKQGDVKAIAALMNRSLQSKGIAVKVDHQGDCLMVIAESTELPDQLFMVDFVRKGIINLNLQTVKRVVVKGQAAGSKISVWREAFDLTEGISSTQIQATNSSNGKASTRQTPSISKTKTKFEFLNKALKLFQENRQIERLSLVCGTFLVTSLFWGLFGTFSPASKNTIQAVLPVNTSKTITGTLVINKIIYGIEGQPCAGEGGYNDIRADAQIVVKDNTGTIIASGVLDQGKGVKPGMNAELLKLYEQIGTESGRGTPLECKFPITIENVPKSNFYMIEIGSRRAMTYKAEELQQNNWKLELSLG